MDDSWPATITFLVEGVMLLIVACIGLVGNILSFTVLSRQGLQKIFHNLLLLLNIFDMVYLLTSVSLFALPSLSPSIFAGTYQTLTLPYILPIAHIGMVSTATTTQEYTLLVGWFHLHQPGPVY